MKSGIRLRSLDRTKSIWIHRRVRITQLVRRTSKKYPPSPLPQISELDLYYLDDEELARQLIELGYRGAGDVLKRDEFEARKKADREKYLHKEVAPKPLASMGKDLSAAPFLQGMLAEMLYLAIHAAHSPPVRLCSPCCSRRAGPKRQAYVHSLRPRFQPAWPRNIRLR